MRKQIYIPQGNYTKGRAGYKPKAIVIHIMQGTLRGTDGWFGGQNLKSGIASSTHSGVGKNGDISDYVNTDDTAYHAGRVAQPIWAGMEKTAWGSFVNPNKYTLGIECEGFRGDIWTEALMTSLCVLVKEYSDKYNIPITRANIIGHSEITIDKEDMHLWVDEIIKRLSTPVPSPSVILNTDTKSDLVALLEKAIIIAKKL